MNAMTKERKKIKLLQDSEKEEIRILSNNCKKDVITTITTTTTIDENDGSSSTPPPPKTKNQHTTTTSPNTNDDDDKNNNSNNCFDLLSDDLVVTIGLWVASLDTRGFAKFRQTCKRFQSILETPEVFGAIVQEKIQEGPQEVIVTNLEQLCLYEAMSKYNLLKENRIGFGFASTEIDDDSGGDNDSGIYGSLKRIESIYQIMKEFPNVSITVDAHCGVAAPLGISFRFSRARGMVVVESIVEQQQEEGEEDIDFCKRIKLRPWGRRISNAVCNSNHPFSNHARTGKGWVDIFVRLGDLEFPSRPEYYNGMTASVVDNDDDAFRYHNLSTIIFRR